MLLILSNAKQFQRVSQKHKEKSPGFSPEAQSSQLSDRCSSSDCKEEKEIRCRNPLLGKNPKFPVSCLQQDCGQGRCCSCSMTLLQRHQWQWLLQPSPVCWGVSTACSRSEQRGLLQRGTMGKREFFSHLSHPGAITRELFSLPRSTSQATSATQPRNKTGCALCEECYSFCKGHFWGKKGSGKCLPHAAVGFRNTATPCYRHRATCNLCTLSLHQINGVLLFLGGL